MNIHINSKLISKKEQNKIKRYKMREKCQSYNFKNVEKNFKTKTIFQKL